MLIPSQTALPICLRLGCPKPSPQANGRHSRPGPTLLFASADCARPERHPAGQGLSLAGFSCLSRHPLPLPLRPMQQCPASVVRISWRANGSSSEVCLRRRIGPAKKKHPQRWGPAAGASNLARIVPEPKGGEPIGGGRNGRLLDVLCGLGHGQFVAQPVFGKRRVEKGKNIC